MYLFVFIYRNIYFIFKYMYVNIIFLFILLDKIMIKML